MTVPPDTPSCYRELATQSIAKAKDNGKKNEQSLGIPRSHCSWTHRTGRASIFKSKAPVVPLWRKPLHLTVRSCGTSLLLTGVGVEKVQFSPKQPKFGGYKISRKLKKSFVGDPSAILFLRISREGVFQQPQAFTPMILIPREIGRRC